MAIDFKEKLNPEQYRVMREKDTERPYSGRYWDHDEGGLYACAACGNLLFSSLTKFDGENGWPCFTDVQTDHSVDLVTTDTGTEVICQNCKSHVGYLATREGSDKQYFRVNSAALDFTAFPELPEEEKDEEDKKDEKKKKITQMSMQAFLALLASIVVGTGIGWAAGSALCGSGIPAPSVSGSPMPSATPTAVLTPSPTPRPTPPPTTPPPTPTDLPASSSGGGVPPL